MSGESGRPNSKDRTKNWPDWEGFPKAAVLRGWIVGFSNNAFHSDLIANTK